MSTNDNVTPLPRAGDAPRETGPRTPPHNPEAEMALLGAILANNRQYDRVGDRLNGSHFADPVHGRIFDACVRLIERGQLATPVTLHNLFARSGELEEYGGPAFLARLASAVPMAGGAADYAREIHDCYLRRELVDVGGEIVEDAHGSDLDNPASRQIEQAEERLFGLAEHGTAEGGFRAFGSALTEAISIAEAAYRRDGSLVGVPTGFRDLDALLGGLHRSDLVVIAARPSMGKTALATNIAYNAASSSRMEADDDGNRTPVPEVVGFFSLEMSAAQLATRIVSEQTEVRSDAIRRGEIRREEFERIFQASQQLQSRPLFIDDTAGLSVAALRTRARRLKRKHGLSLIIIDYLQLMQPTAGARSDSRVQEVSEITRGLKALAKDLDVPVIALSQLSREVEKRPDQMPQLSDLRESGSIEQDADVVMFIYREEYYLERMSREKRDNEKDDAYTRRMERLERSRNRADIIVAKQRHGPIRTVRMHFAGEFTRFSDLAESDRIPDGPL